MRATVMYQAGDVRVETVPDARLVEPTDALLRVTRACICGSDLWPYNLMEPEASGRPMGHEAIGIVEDIGAGVRTLKAGDLVVMPFAYSDGTCVICRDGIHTACLNGGFFGCPSRGRAGRSAAHPAGRRHPVPLPVDPDDALMASLLTLSDVMGTGHHAAVTARVGPGKSVAVIGDGAVGLCGVIAARRLGAEQIVIMGRRPDRIALAREFGATDVVSERGDEAAARVRDLTGGLGVGIGTGMRRHRPGDGHRHRHRRPGGGVGRVGVPHYETPDAWATAFYKNLTIGGGPAPSAPTWTSCFPPCSRAGSSPAASSTESSASTKCPTATGR